MPDSPDSIRKALVRFADALGEAIERDGTLLAAARDLVRTLGGDGDPPASDAAAREFAPLPDQGRSMGAALAEEREGEKDLATQGELEELSAVLSSKPDVAAEASASVPASRRRAESSPRIIADRCRLKQRACDLAAELDETLETEGELRPHEDFQSLIGQAKALPDCYLWMLRTETRGWIAPEHWRLLGRCFGNLAQAIELADALVEAGNDRGGEIQGGLTLAAEAQRAVRQAVVSCVPPGRNFEDSDQLAAYRWISRQCETLRIFVARYMKIDDLADPRDWRDLQGRIHQLGARREEASEKQRGLKKLFGKIRYESQRLVDASLSEVEQRVEKIAQAVHELVGEGVAPSDTRLRDLLLPVFEILLDSTEMPYEGFLLALREMDRYLARREQEGAALPEEEKAESPDVARVREWLRGRSVVMVGGEERPEVVRRLEKAFALGELVWIATRPHESTEGFRAPIQREEVALVLLAIRWSSHSYGGIREYCEAVGKPLVRLPGGYGTNRVAAEIVAQASEALARDAGETGEGGDAAP